jgi:hypothetical protein
MLHWTTTLLGLSGEDEALRQGLNRPRIMKQKKHQKHTTAGIHWQSPT